MKLAPIEKIKIQELVNMALHKEVDNQIEYIDIGLKNEAHHQIKILSAIMIKLNRL